MINLLRRVFTTAHRKVVLTGTGKDRIGIIKDITGIIFDEEGNIADSRMSKLEQNFALMILVEIPEKNFEKFKKKIEKSNEVLGIHLDVTDLHIDSEKTIESQDYKASIEVICDDHPGILYSLTQHLANQGINIDKVDTYNFSAPMGGTTLFKIKSKVSVKKVINFDSFKESLKSLQSSLLADIKIYKEGDNHLSDE